MDVFGLVKAGIAARKAFRVWNQNRKRKKRAEKTSELLDEEEISMSEKKQVLQGKLTHSGLAVTAVSWLLDKADLAVAGFDQATVAGVVIGLVAAVYGRIRRELRDDE